METETDLGLPFLDVNIMKNCDGIKTTIYRKPTHTNQYINFQSNHSINIKSAIISTLVKRAINICHPSYLQLELDQIRDSLCTLNNYPKKFVDRIISSSLKPKPVKPKEEKSGIWTTIPYVGTTSYQIRRLLAKHGIETGFKYQPTLKDLLQANGKSITTKPNQQKGCVYKITCSCQELYIGESRRPLEKRLKEHRSKGSTNKSAVCNHLKGNPRHRVDWDKVQILAKNIKNKKERKLIEAINIKRYQPKLNLDQGLYIPKAYDNLL